MVPFGQATTRLTGVTCRPACPCCSVLARRASRLPERIWGASLATQRRSFFSAGIRWAAGAHTGACAQQHTSIPDDSSMLPIPGLPCSIRWGPSSRLCGRTPTWIPSAESPTSSRLTSRTLYERQYATGTTICPTGTLSSMRPARRVCPQCGNSPPSPGANVSPFGGCSQGP